MKNNKPEQDLSNWSVEHARHPGENQDGKGLGSSGTERGFFFGGIIYPSSDAAEKCRQPLRDIIIRTRVSQSNKN